MQQLEVLESVQFKLPSNLRERLRQQAAIEDRTQTKIVIRALERYFQSADS